jgi:broad specificity phosphatase PhoE
MIPEGEKIRFFYSPFKRTLQTFEEIKKSFNQEELKATEDPRLREQEWGNLQHFQNEPEKLDKVYQERDQVGRFFYRFPTGESGADVYDRYD